MHPPTAHGGTLPPFWPRVRAYAVPPAMIETATARRRAGDWAGACAAAARVDADLRPRDLARTHGRDLADRVRADLARLAPDLLRRHLPRIAPDGLLRPGLTIPLARYDHPGDGGGPAPVHLVVRTPPARADGGQRIALTLWDGDRLRHGARTHPHPRPSRRFRLDLHRHLWDADRSGELRTRAGTGRPDPLLDGQHLLPPGHRFAVDRWADEARTVLRDAGHDGVPSASGVARGITARPGDTPRSWRRWAEEVVHPPQPWRELLGSALRAAVSGSGAGEDYSYGRPSRRSSSVPGAVLPSLRRTPPRVSVVIDTSGSVSDGELGSALLEVAAISRAVGGRRDLSRWCPATRPPAGCTGCAGPRASRSPAAGGRICGRASPGRWPHGPGPTSWSSSRTDRHRGRRPGHRAGRWWVSSPATGRPGTRTTPSTFPTARPHGRAW
ncbi:hypothetical protein SUDANB70_00173 [Streptomyces sp. enrichment culture]